MPSPAGFSGQVGFKTETTWGTPVVVDKFIGFTEEGMKADREKLYDPSIRANRLVRSFAKKGRVTVAGDMTLVLPNVTLATLLKHMFGAVTTTGAGPYTHTATPAGLVAQSMTMQWGRPDSSGTVRPFTYSGVKIEEWELSCAVGEWALLKLTLTGKDETTATSLAVASYAAGYNPFTFVEGSLSIAGSAVGVHNVTLRGGNTLRTDHFHIGSEFISEQYDNGYREYTGEAELDFTDLTAYNRVVNDTQAALVLAFNNGTQTFTITANVTFTGETPVMSGPEALVQPYQFECISATSDAAAITAVLVNAESSAS